MLSKNKINKIRSLRREEYSIRKIAKRLKISKDTVLKYLKSTPPVKKILLAHKIGTTDVTASSGDVSTNSKDIEWSQLFREKPLGSTTVQGISSSEFPNTYGPVQDYSYNRDDRPPRRRGIRFDQPYMESDYYLDDLSYGDQYGAPRRRGIPVPRIKHGTQEESTLQIIKEYNDQKQKQKLQSLSKEVDRLDKWEREKREFEKKSNEMRRRKLASDQNKKTESDNLKKISPTIQDNKIESISHVKELQKTEKLEGQKKLTNHESTYTDKNLPIHDSNNDKSTGLDTGMAFRLLAEGFEGFFTGIVSAVGHKQNKVKHNNITPKKVTLIPRQEVTLTPIIEVNLREVKKKEEIVLIPLDK